MRKMMRANVTARRIALTLLAPAGIFVSACTAAGGDAGHAPLPDRYPAAETGYLMKSFRLTRRPDENALRVKLEPSKVEARSCNDPPYVGRLQEKSLPDSNARYYVLQIRREPRFGPMAPCPMIPPGPVGVDGDLSIPYDSAAPVVVYLPAEFSLTYRVETAPGKQ